jgi:uncharacterized protein YndB with AHSA1/START domain
MASTIITPDLDAVVSEILIAAPPERVFQALIDPQQVLVWWTGENCRIRDFTLEPRRGGKWTYDTEPSKLTVTGVNQFHCEGEVLEYDPPRALAYTWVANWHQDKSRRTVVHWELVADGVGTRLKVTHSGLGEEPASREDYSGGWTGVMQQLKTFVEQHN